MLITIDGPAKSGKSRAAELLAAELGYELLNTGAMYRAAGLKLKSSGINIEAGSKRDKLKIADLVDSFHFECHGHRVILNGIDFTNHIALPANNSGNAASLVGEFREVRDKLKAEQRRIAGSRDMICEGRDQGTAVFPEAAIKFFLTASVAVRAKRQAAKEGRTDLPEIERQIEERDFRDKNRCDEYGPLDPLVKAADAIEIDTSYDSESDTMAKIREVVRQWRSKA